MKKKEMNDFIDREQAIKAVKNLAKSKIDEHKHTVDVIDLTGDIVNILERLPQARLAEECEKTEDEK